MCSLYHLSAFDSTTALLPLKFLMILSLFQEKDEKLDGDAALNKFFREIYSDADEDMRRAMMKSFVCALHPRGSPLVN